MRQTRRLWFWIALLLTLALGVVITYGVWRDNRPPAAAANRQADSLTARLRALNAEVTVETSLRGEMVSVDLRLVRDLASALSLVAQLPRVDRLNLHDTPLRVGDCELLRKLPTLRWLDLSRTQIGDQDLAFLEDTPAMEFLILWGTGVSDGGLPRVARLTRLQKLDLSGTQISGVGVPHLAQLGSLAELYLESPGLDEADISRLRQALPHALIVH